MSARAPIFGSLVLFFAVLLWLAPAQAWIETQVRGHAARVEVAQDGSVTVRHELRLKVRGGPMKTLEISGVGTNIEPLPDAVVRRAEEGSDVRFPVHVAAMEDGAIRLGVSADHGLRGGNYLFSFAYTVPLRDLVGSESNDKELVLSWVGPRLSTGVDSARVTFVVPHGAFEPRLAPTQDGLSANVLLGEVRRGSAFDEVDLVRAHLATGEPAVWRIAIAPGSLALGSSHDSTKSAEMAAGLANSLKGSRNFQLHLAAERYPWIVGLALFYSMVLWRKVKSVAALGAIYDAKVVPLLPMPAAARVLFAGALVAALVWAVFEQRLVWALLALSAALLVGTFLLPVRRVRPRGPGHWVFASPPVPKKGERLPGVWFDVRSPQGCLLLLGVLCCLLVLSYRTLPDSNYLALMVLLGIPLLFPLFGMGSRRDFPQAPVEQAGPWHRYLVRAIDPALAKVELWGRVPALLDGDPNQPVPTQRNDWDEVRIRFLLSSSPAGLRSIEVTLEEGAGAHVSPCVLLRVLEDSRAFASLPQGLHWQRGRIAEERVALIRPPAPTPAQTARLVRLLLKTLQTTHPASSSKPSKSAGSGQLTGSKPAVGMQM